MEIALRVVLENISNAGITDSYTNTPNNGKVLQTQVPCISGVFNNSTNSPLSILTKSGNLIKSSINCTDNTSVTSPGLKGFEWRKKQKVPLHDLTNADPNKRRCHGLFYMAESTNGYNSNGRLPTSVTTTVDGTLNDVTYASCGESHLNRTVDDNCLVRNLAQDFAMIDKEHEQQPIPNEGILQTDPHLNSNEISTCQVFEPEKNSVISPTPTIAAYIFVVAYMDIGDPNNICEHCNAIYWYEERVDKAVRTGTAKYSTCCGHGKIKLPRMSLPPKRIFNLFFERGTKRNEFLKHIRRYNNMFSFTSLGAKVDKSINSGNCPPIFRINGQNYHLMGGLMPEVGKSPKFAQLYIHDTENEVENRINAFSGAELNDPTHVDIVQDIKVDLDEHNVLVQSFRWAKTQIDNNPQVNFKMRLIGKRQSDARTYNLPTASEVAALIVGDLDPTLGQRDIIVETKSGSLKRINELNPAYLPLQYPLLFPLGEDGYREDIQYGTTSTKPTGARVRVSQREYFAYRIHDRLSELSTMLYAKRLYQQFLVDAYTMVESGRLLYIRNNQKSLRCEAYKGLSDALTRGEVDTNKQGKRIILPSTFTGGARYMIQNYQDAMAICRHKGYPNLFITFTCNPKWPEIQRYMDKCNHNAEDRPDIVSRVFKMKLDALVKEIRNGKLFGIVTAVVYTIEFQKRGLPHAHILIFLERLTKGFSANHMDEFISAEIPNKELDIEYFKAVGEFMMHGPCGQERPKSPCMVNKKCSKHFPKKFAEVSTLDHDGYPIYRRRDNGATVERNGVKLDSRYCVPHNRYLLLKYKAHINVEWCNQSRSIKYLFKYVNKGNDKVTAEFYKSTNSENENAAVDEITMYYDCRYVSACEAAWRLLSFDVQLRHPPVERLSFHLPDCQTVVFEDDDRIEHVLNRPTVNQSMFTAWFDANKKYEAAKELAYIDMPSKFVWKKDIREWHPRKRGFSIGRIFFVPPGSGEVYYLRCLLNVVRGPTSFQDIRTVQGVVY
ncbi:uncharacterized protein LOC116033064 [Ipomoea triloba]|uniref:uncharacterized protein LOC116033064 n=1 Tax=Ipomoea triloba TaxID=35885 RepID=UPI00125D4F4E|nr:uncharacterized protein LOC116033064 [Ipomoea triloba]